MSTYLLFIKVMFKRECDTRWGFIVYCSYLVIVKRSELVTRFV